jgi:hypothetical protein
MNNTNSSTCITNSLLCKVYLLAQILHQKVLELKDKKKQHPPQKHSQGKKISNNSFCPNLKSVNHKSMFIRKLCISEKEETNVYMTAVSHAFIPIDRIIKEMEARGEHTVH